MRVLVAVWRLSELLYTYYFTLLLQYNGSFPGEQGQPVLPLVQLLSTPKKSPWGLLEHGFSWAWGCPFCNHPTINEKAPKKTQTVIVARPHFSSSSIVFLMEGKMLSLCWLADVNTNKLNNAERKF